MLTWMTSGVLSACLSSSSKSDADFLIIWSSSWIDILPGVVGTGSFSLSNSNLKINYLHVHLEHHFGTFQCFSWIGLTPGEAPGTQLSQILSGVSLKLGDL